MHQGGAYFVGLEAEGAGFGFEDDLAVLVDEVDAVGPSGVGLFGGVAKFVEHRGKLYPQLAHAGTGDEGALIFIFRAGKDDFVADVAFHLPNVAGMGFENVDHQKRNLAVVLIVEFVEGRNLPPERRSSVASEDQNHRLSRGQRRQLDAFGLVQPQQCEVRSRIAGA